VKPAFSTATLDVCEMTHSVCGMTHAHTSKARAMAADCGMTREIWTWRIYTQASALEWLPTLVPKKQLSRKQ